MERHCSRAFLLRTTAGCCGWRLNILAAAFGLGLLLSYAGGMVVHADPGEPSPPESCRFGVFPFLPLLTLDRVMAPLVHYLSDELRVPVMLHSKPSFEGFVAALNDGAYDFTFLHPFLYVDSARQHGYHALVRLNPPLTIVILARSEQGSASLAGLRGGTVGLPPRLSAASILVKQDLEQAGLIDGTTIRLRYFQSKLSCVQAVYIGDTQACGVPRLVLKSIQNYIEGLHIIHETSPIPGPIIAVHERVPEQIRDRITTVFLNFATTPRGREILSGLGWEGFIATNDHDYAALGQDFNAAALHPASSRMP